MKQLMRRIFRLTWIAVSGPEAWRGFLTYGIVLALQFFGVWISVRMITWNKAFYDALENMDAGGAVQQIWIFAGLVALSAGSFLIGDWLRKRLQMRWRARLTSRALDLWVGGRAYWALRPGMSPAAIDNPDQRVAEDCRLFVNRLLMETLDLISSIVALVSYVALLWSLSSFPLAFTLGGIQIEIPRYMVWAAFLYVALSSVITHLLGKPLKSVIFTQEKREADFRHALIQLREGASVIAQAGGEAAEQRRLDRLFDAIRQNWFLLVNKELVLGLFSRPYMQTVLRIPTFLALPAYFAGAVTLGGLMQLASAFSNVATTLSWFIFSYRDLAEFVAVSERLDGLFTAGADPAPMPDAPREISHGAGASVTTTGLRLHTPEGRALAPTPDLAIAPGEKVWIRGASGEGKSTLLAALSGLWPYGHGRIDAPADLMVLPQTPRIFPEGLLAAAAYPQAPDHYGAAAIRAALDKVGLGHLTEDRPLADLSGGERQRLALARALLARPGWLALDEATSALDAAAEDQLIALLLRELPDTTLIAVSHRATPAMAGWREIAIG